MASSSYRGSVLLGVVVLVVSIAAACGGGGGGSTFGDNDSGANGDGTSGGDDGACLSGCGNDGGLGGDGAEGQLTIDPADKIVDVNSGQPPPTVQYTARVGGQAVTAAFSIDRGEIGTIDVGGGLFTPKGTLGGVAHVTAAYMGLMASTTVTVHLHVTQNGDPNAGDAGSGVGGNGGVGGEGNGGSVDPGVVGVLNGQPMSDPGLAWLYPYDKTVWPRGILAPLLQWTPGAAGTMPSYDAIYIHLQEASYEYKGYFAKTRTPFIHHPVEQDAWKALAYSNAGEDVTVTLVFAANGKAYGPLTETWKIASGPLKGTVYYNSYGTNLAHNYCCTLGGKPFGGATLAIKGGSTDPVLVAGNDTDCRVCHSVAASGSRLVTQQANNGISSAYDLKNNNAETVMNPGDGRFSWAALYPDGTFLFSNSATQQGANSTLDSALYQIPSGAPIAATGLPAGFKAACPVFSPDGKHVAYNTYSADQKSLAAMDFANNAFTNTTPLYTPAAGTAVWPSFLPTNDAIVFELETAYNGRDFGGTRSTCDSGGPCSDSGTRAELWWLDLKTKRATRLDKLNGLGYLPTGANAHDMDATLNYEPTVNPVPSGGYAWVVFTSRRLYGNVASINPYWSDPRYHDLTTDPTPKKLWVAAIDLNAPPGTDPSHPAFYLPGRSSSRGTRAATGSSIRVT